VGGLTDLASFLHDRWVLDLIAIHRQIRRHGGERIKRERDAGLCRQPDSVLPTPVVVVPTGEAQQVDLETRAVLVRR
jgi:hypothetical protein